MSEPPPPPKEHDCERTKIDFVLDRANTQPEPLKDGDHDEFFATLGHVWHVADKFHLDIPFTNFLMFGPQSSGKTTITERILGFPVSVVKSEIGTTRPMVLTTRRANEEAYQVKGPNDRDFQLMDKRLIRDWVKVQMESTGFLDSGSRKISQDHISVEASGPAFKNRRFVDLPGFQTIDVNGREDILELLRKEMENPHTVAVCIEDSTTELANSNLVVAFQEVFGKEFARRTDLLRRFVLVLNKSDSWLQDAGVTRGPFISRIYSYVTGCGLVPILVGASVDPINNDLRRRQAEGKAGFDELAAMYQHANNRERDLYNEKFSAMRLPQDLEGCLASKFRGFGNLLRTVDAMVFHRDVAHAEGIANQMGHIRDAAETKIQSLKRAQEMLSGDDQGNIVREAKSVVKNLLKYLSEVATNKWGDGSVVAAMDTLEIKQFGNDARMEEMEFIFGSRDGNEAPPFNGRDFKWKGYYNPGRTFPVLSGCAVVNLPAGIGDNWLREMYKTVKDLEESKKIGGISHLQTKLVNGQVYKRAFALWSSTVYRLVIPSPEDLLRLPNTRGINPDMLDDGGDIVKAQRLAKIYIHRLTPAISFLCQKMEFLLLQNFDTAWRVLLRMDRTKDFVEAVGSEDFKNDLRREFEKAVKKRAELVYDMCFSDLSNELLKLLPYSKERAPVTGMLYANPEVEIIIDETKNDISENVKTRLKKILEVTFPNGISGAFLTGIQSFATLLAAASSFNPLFFAGIQVAISLLRPFIEKRAKIAENKRSKGQSELDEDRDLNLLGFAVCLYANCLPSFIATIDARMCGGLWSYVEDADLISQLEEYIEKKSDIIQKAKQRLDDIKLEIKHLEDRANEVDKVNKMLMAIIHKFPKPILSAFSDPIPDTRSELGELNEVKLHGLDNGVENQNPQQQEDIASTKNSCSPEEDAKKINSLLGRLRNLPNPE